ncbi:MAG TPA: hypothetical protein IAB68_02705 [Candidatus Aphodocola excrementigallinarum]|uniref:Uncharacterized protein n=1 Tax=Candidatus Aphodocola excrementigallinarum TaxID=2840670 RepID=A0A9D1LIP6_9FIRM|nr:hypothetical protein [Candidatus Aphodocola excrementigallinarum]
MTFDKQVEEAKKKKLKSRITRDVVFIILGITFLAISVVMSVIEKNNEENKNNDDNKKVVTTEKQND